MTKLPEITLKVFEFILRYKTEHDGNSPSYQQIANAVGLKSVSTIKIHITTLRDAGLLKHEFADSRSIEVIGGKWTYEIGE